LIWERDKEVTKKVILYMLIIEIIKEKGEQQRRLEFHNITVTLYKKIRVLYRE
jgi:hypothetical protein